MKLTQIGLAAGFLVGISCVLSSIHPWGDARKSNPPAAPFLSPSDAPEEVRNLLESKCANCHSSSTHWPVYSRFAPASWLIENDIQEARLAMNLSNWPDYAPQDRAVLLARIAVEVRNGRMPVGRYLLLHPDARLTEADRQAILSWTRDERKRLRAQIKKTNQETTK